MKDYQVFGLIVRTFALVSMFYALMFTGGIVDPGEGYDSSSYAWSVAVFGAFGVLLLFGADTIVRMSYRLFSEDRQTSDDADDQGKRS